MKALVFHEPGRMQVEELGRAVPSRGEVRVRVAYAGVCGTDRRIFAGTKSVRGPRVIGHEFAGVIDEIGEGVGGWTVGDRVAVYPIIACGTCHACLEGRRNICVRRRTFGYEIDGGFAEQVIVVAEAVEGGNLVRVPDGVDDVAAAAAEPVAAALQGALRAGIRSGDSVLILGAGPIGSAHIELSRLIGAAAIVVSEPDPQRREAALRRGATHIVDPAIGPLAEQVREALGGESPRVAILDVGAPELVAETVGAVRKGGRVVIFAGMPTGTTVNLDPNAIHYGEIDVVGSSGSTPALLAQALAWAAEGRLDLRSLVSTVLTLEQWPAAFDGAEIGGLKSVFALGSAVPAG